MVKIGSKPIDPWPAAERPIVTIDCRIVLIHVNIVIVPIRIERNTSYVDEARPYCNCGRIRIYMHWFAFFSLFY